jgi:hypothetical protein
MDSAWRFTIHLEQRKRAMFGRCYRYALETLLDLHTSLSTGVVTVGSGLNSFDLNTASAPDIKVPQLGNNPVLVHGMVVGDTGEIKDKRFEHAWLEGNGFVMDCGSAVKEHTLLTRDAYYEYWRIKPDECRRYTFQEAIGHVLCSGWDSGWHEPSPGVLPEMVRGCDSAPSCLR